MNDPQVNESRISFANPPNESIVIQRSEANSPSTYVDLRQGKRNLQDRERQRVALCVV